LTYVISFHTPVNKPDNIFEQQDHLIAYDRA
jgi:hypothetical protein